MTIEELVEQAHNRARIILVNDAHSGPLRSVATRMNGLRMLHRLHALGVRHLAMEALYPHTVADVANTRRRLDASTTYLRQPEMQALIDQALAYGWTLIAYEVMVPLTGEGQDEEIATNERERGQALNLLNAIGELTPTTSVLVWCGNHHLAMSTPDWWVPMGIHLREALGDDVFALDQLSNVRFDADRPPIGDAWARTFEAEIRVRGGGAGFLAQEAPADWPLDLADGYVLLLDADLS